MKNLFRIAEAAFVLLVTGCVIYLIGFKHQQSLPAKTSVVANVVKNPVAPIINQFKDAVGENHTQVAANANKISPADLRDTNLIRKSILDTIMKRVNIKNAKDILEITQLNEKLLIENAKLKKDTNTKGQAILYFRDKWLDASVNLKDSTFNLSYDADITTTKFNRWKFSPLPSRISAYDFYGDDPRMTIIGAKHLLIEQPDPFFGVKVQARTSYDIHSGNLIPSAGVELKLGPFDLGGRYYYSIAHGQWQPIVSGTLNLLNIK